MNVLSAALSLYLLFPILNERQQKYSELIGKNDASNPKVVERRLELIKFLGLDESDFASADEIAFVSENDEENKNAEKKKDVMEVYLRDIQNHLKQYEIDEEKFSIADRKALRSTVVSVNKETFCRIRYDSSYRIMESIVWKNSPSLSESVMLNKKNWFYSEDAVYMTEEDLLANVFSDAILNEKNLPVKISYYEVSEKKSEDEKKDDVENKSSENKSVGKEKEGSIKNLSKIDYYDYDGQGRVILEREEFFKQSVNESTGRKKDVVVYTTEKKFDYKSGLDSPDIILYEDGKLRRKIQRLDEDSYWEFIYFPGGAEVKSKYVNGTKVKEEMFLNESGENKDEGF